jgi:hypothetical protein
LELPNPEPEKPGFIRRILGNPVSDRLGQKWPELQREFVKREFDMPREANKTNKIMEMGPIFKWMNPDAYAVTGPFGTVSLNRQLIERDKQNLGDVLTHELAHIGQGKKGFLRQIYEPSQVENEAINREAMRYRPRDIILPVEQKKGLK